MKKFWIGFFGVLVVISMLASYIETQEERQLVIANDKMSEAVEEVESSKITNLQVKENGVEVNVESLDWLSKFEIITEKEFMDVLDKSDIKRITKNTTTNSLFIVMEDGEQYKVEHPSTEMISYLALLDIDYNTRNFTEKVEITPEKVEKTQTQSSYAFAGQLLVLLIVGVFFYNIWLKFDMKRAKKIEKNSVTVRSLPTENERGKKDKDTDSEIPNVKFDDVEGIEELKTDIFRLVDCLKNPDKYISMGARTPKGVILYGPPGTGKTLLAKAIAGEAGVPFFSMVGSDFIEKYVGVGASRVRDLYKKARKAAPCIVFIDEIDAVAGQRGTDENSERDQTINALLAELDGFKGTENIITICATNRLDMLDSAFTRAGRFDLKLAVGLPDKSGRERILKIHSRNKRLADKVSFEVLANKTVGFSGAELESMMNEAAMLAAGRGKHFIDYKDIDDAFFKIVMQGNKKKRDKITEMNKIVAWHEAGHTLVTKLLTDDRVPSVTIVGSSSGAGGVTFRAPNEDNALHSKKYLESIIQVMYGGRAAEEIYFNDLDSITTGASQDIKQASSVIKEYLSVYGMGKMGMLDLTQFKHDYDDIIDEASEMAHSLYSKTVNLLRDNYDTLDRLASSLLEKETLEEKEIDEIIDSSKGSEICLTKCAE